MTGTGRRGAASRAIRCLVAVAVVAAVGWGAARSASAQQATGEDARRPAADPADVSSIDAIVTALYDVISGPAGEPRDWDRFRSLLHPDAFFLPVSAETGEPVKSTVEEFIENATAYTAENGFFEREVARTTQRYGPVAQLFSTYESRHAADDPEPFVRGVNSIQLVHDGTRWWVVQIAWADEQAAGPIPEEYLP